MALSYQHIPSNHYSTAASTAMDPWLIAAANRNLHAWTKQPQALIPATTAVPSLFDDESYEEYLDSCSPPSLSPPTVPHKHFLSTSAKIDPWTVTHFDLTNKKDIQVDSASQSEEHDMGASNLYKTELCRSFVETGVCRYGQKCQFAHGRSELRPVHRHPKYKTEICKTFHTLGTCPYGSRCRFIHTRDGSRDSSPSSSRTSTPTCSRPSSPVSSYEVSPNAPELNSPEFATKQTWSSTWSPERQSTPALPLQAQQAHQHHHVHEEEDAQEVPDSSRRRLPIFQKLC